MQEFSSLIELLAMLVTDPRTGVLFALLAVASVIDYRTYKIPNWLTMGGAVFGLGYSIVVPFSAQAGFLWALGGLALGFAMLLPLYVLKAMGAGDVKLMAMAGAFLGVTDAFYAVVCTFIVGGVAALAFAMFHRALGRMLSNIKAGVHMLTLSAIGGIRPHVLVDAKASVGKLPYGVSIGIGTIGYLVMKQLGYL